MKRLFWVVCFLSLVLLTRGVPVFAADGLTAQQVQLLDSLTPAQKKALLDKYRGELEAPVAATASQQPQEPLISPRTPEDSRMEQGFGRTPRTWPERDAATTRPGPERNAVTTGTELAPPVAVAPAEVSFPPDETGKTLPAVVDKPALPAYLSQTPLRKVDTPPAAAAPELNQAFADMVEAARPVFVDTELQQFGYDLFAGSPTTFAPVNDVPVPAEYVLGPGDELKVQLFGKVDDQLAMVVDRQGMVAFPGIGPLTVSGMSFAEAKAYIAEQIKEKTIGVSASISMGNLRSIRIFALGDVERPGSYLVSGLATVSQALFVSGGVKKIGSLRKIAIKRGGSTVSTLDLYDFLLRGDTRGDVRLQPGDVVFVPPIGPTVGVAGEVLRPAIYEVNQEKTVAQALALAGGLLPTAYRASMLMERVDDHKARTVLQVKLQGEGVNTRLQNHDLLKVAAVLAAEENPIFLAGNVKRPGKYAWKSGMRLSDLLPDAEVLLPEAYLPYGLIEREAVATGEPELLQFRLGDLFTTGPQRQAADLPLQPRDKVYVFNQTHFREMPSVMVAGSVQAPGRYQLKRSMRLSDLVLAAGGLLRDADRSAAELYRTDATTKEVQVFRYSLAAGPSQDDALNPPLQDQDRLVIHSLWESKNRYEVSVAGEVNYPGNYELAQGMRLADLVFAAGNITDRAYVNLAEITRYTVVNDERRVTDHLQVDLAAALHGDPQANLPLRPYDSLTVRTLSNWRQAEKVTLAGEIKYPGDYPIEEGEHLSSLLQRAGGFLPDAYLRGALFTRESIRQNQEEQLKQTTARIEEEITLLEGSVGGINDAQLVKEKKESIAAAKRVNEQLKKVKATGRLVIRLTDLASLRDSVFDLKLRDGDRLYVPKQSDEVHIVGQVYNQTALLFNPDFERDDYLSRAGGVTRFADSSNIYVVRANGEVDRQEGWGEKRIFPGDVIVVPEEIDRFSLLDSTLDWSRVLMQLGIGVASMSTLGIL